MSDKLTDLAPQKLQAKGDEVQLRPSPEPEAIEALDKLAAEVAGKQSVADVPPVTPVDSSATPPVAVVPPVESSTTPPAAVSSATPPVVTETPVIEDFEKIELPPGSKSKSAQAFDNLKLAARERVSQVSQQLTEAATREKKLIEELETLRASSGKVTPEVEQELKQLRAEHVALDVHNDPEFKKFDSTIQANVEVIYSKLLEGGLTDENIARIKELGGPDKIEWKPILDKIPDNTRRFIEATLVDNARLDVAKNKALAEAKSNAERYTKDRTTREQQVVTTTAAQFTKDIPWMHVQEIPANATPEQKAALEKSNKDAQAATEKLNGFLSDRSPAMFGELAVAAILAYRFKDQLTQAVAERDSVKGSSEKQVAALTKEVSELKAKLDGIKRAQIPRQGGGLTPPAPAAKKTTIDTSGAEALDALAAQVKSQGEDE